ncbi:MAG: hypothetical protein JSW54_00530, partial [Fidelibacterota bacterium]
LALLLAELGAQGAVFNERRNPADVVVITMSGEQYGGHLLWATKSALALWRQDGPFRVEHLEQYLLVLPATDVRRITVLGRGSGLSGCAKGVLLCAPPGALLGLVMTPEDEFGGPEFGAVAGGILGGLLGGTVGGIHGISRARDEVIEIGGDRRVFSSMENWFYRHASFASTGPPIPVRRALAARIRASRPPSADTETAPAPPAADQDDQLPAPVVAGHKPEPAPRGRAVRLSAGGGTWLAMAHRDVRKVFRSSGFGGTSPGVFLSDPTTYPTSYIEPYTACLEAEFDISNRLRVGVVLEDNPRQIVRGYDGEEETIKGGLSYSLLVAYVQDPLDPTLPLAARRWEHAIGAGICTRPVAITGDLGGNSPGFSVSEQVTGLQARASLEYYLSRHTSLQLRVDATWLPGVEVPSQSYDYLDSVFDWETGTYVNELRTRTLEAHTVNLSSIYFSMGLRFHVPGLW